jgi:hypothetical protein
MALSNWDTMLLDQKGKPLPGSWTSPKGIKVEVYKNWVHIHDEKAWVEDGASYMKPIVMRMESGQIHYKDVEILVLRGPQNGAFLVAWSDIYSKDYKKHKVVGCIGCGVYGFSGDRYTGVTRTALKWFMKELNKTTIDHDTMYSSDFIKGKWKKTKEIFKVVRAIHDAPEEFKKIDLLKGQRYNQGDAYFAVRINSNLQNTTPGKAKPTVFNQLLKKDKLCQSQSKSTPTTTAKQ